MLHYVGCNLELYYDARTYEYQITYFLVSLDTQLRQLSTCTNEKFTACFTFLTPKFFLRHWILITTVHSTLHSLFVP
jgi:hypothetical protein